MADKDALRPLPTINPATDRPWICVAIPEHDCTGPVVGAIGAVPVCANGEVVERASRIAERERVRRWVEDNADLLAREAAAEMAFERRANRY